MRNYLLALALLVVAPAAFAGCYDYDVPPALIRGGDCLYLLKVNSDGSINTANTSADDYAQGSTTSDQVGPLVQGATTTAAPTYTTAKTNPLSLTVLGSLRVDLASLLGVAMSQGTGAVGTGTPRVAVGTDTATIAGSAPGTAGTASANVVSVQGLTSGLPIGVRGGNSAFNGSADQLVKSGAGDLIGIFVASSTTCTIKVWDNTSAATTILVNTFSASAASWYPLPFHFGTGLYVDITNTCDYSVSYN